MKKNNILYIFFLFILNFIILKNIALGNTESISNKENINKDILTVEEATEKAIRNSGNIESKKDSIPMIMEEEENLREIVSISKDPIQIVNANAKLMEIQMRRSLTLDDIETTKDNIMFSIINSFSSIISAEKSLELYDENLKIEEKELLISKTRKDLGLESQRDYENKKNNYETSKNRRSSLIEGINSSYRSLNLIMGEDVNKQYKLYLDLKFKKLDDIDIENFTNISLDNSIKVKSADNSVRVAQYKLNSYVASVYDFALKKTIENSVSRDAVISELKETGRNAESLKENIKNKILETYNKIKNTEKDLESKTIQLENSYKELQITEKRFKLGKILPIEIDRLKYSIKQQEEDLRKSKIDYTLMVMEFQNPNILLGNL